LQQISILENHKKLWASWTLSFFWPVDFTKIFETIERN